MIQRRTESRAVLGREVRHHTADREERRANLPPAGGRAPAIVPQTREHTPRPLRRKWRRPSCRQRGGETASVPPIGGGGRHPAAGETESAAQCAAGGWESAAQRDARRKGRHCARLRPAGRRAPASAPPKGEDGAARAHRQRGGETASTPPERGRRRARLPPAGGRAPASVPPKRGDGVAPAYRRRGAVVASEPPIGGGRAPACGRRVGGRRPPCCRLGGGAATVPPIRGHARWPPHKHRAGPTGWACGSGGWAWAVIRMPGDRSSTECGLHWDARGSLRCGRAPWILHACPYLTCDR